MKILHTNWLGRYAVCLLFLVKALYWVNLLLLKAHHWVVMLLDSSHWQACMKVHLGVIVKTLKALNTSPRSGVYFWDTRMKSRSIYVKMGLGYIMLRTTKWATMHKPTFEFVCMKTRFNYILLGLMCRSPKAQKWLKPGPKGRRISPSWVTTLMSNGLSIGPVILGYVHDDGGYRQNFKCKLPSLFKRSWFICNSLKSGHTDSVCMCRTSYLCTPKKGRMISYFWSPKSVSGMKRGYAPLIV
ncbi:hypothetical protein HanRHA438_Chr12g0554041 [Helianthus annuus]|nr:hypothetical protein HanIR_Chr12g0585061 [Helianthus annuus]KAJ0866633.1 hypothetical protein HanRHA438_Chr12g0554041 [Helianthus annuus]